MPRGHGRGRRHHGGAEEGSGERWLLTYADMITLLMALFMVLFSISSINISKYQTLQKSLKAAFSGNILPGGKAIAQQGSTDNASQTPASVELQAIEPVATQGSSSLQNSTLRGASTSTSTSTSSSSASTATSTNAAAAALRQAANQKQAAEFARIKQEIEAYAKAHGFAKSVTATIEARGLVIRVLTDDLLFASGQASLEGRAGGLLSEIAQLLNVDETHPISVEGNTDNVPIHSSQFPSNWELSTARASTVVRFLIAHGVSASRLTASGNAEQHPFDSNATAAGRARNRRVEIVMRRIHGAAGESEGEGEAEPET
jgi:chemotaxis protein MotB